MSESTVTEHIEFVGGPADGDSHTFTRRVVDESKVRIALIESRILGELLEYERTDRKTQEGRVIYEFVGRRKGRIR